MGRHDGVVRHHVDALAHGFLGVAEAGQPFVEVDAAVPRELDALGRHAEALHVRYHFLAAHVLCAAVRVRHDHDVLHAQLAYCDQQRAHDAAEGVGHLGAGHLDDFRVAVLQPQRRQQQRGEARVHARDDGQLLVGVLVGGVTFEVAALHERAVVREDAVDGGGGGRLLLIHKSLLSSEALMIAQPAPAQCANECFT